MNRGMKMFAVAAVATTGIVAGSAQAERVVGTQAVYHNESGQAVLNDTTNYSARDNGDGTFLVNIGNILASTMTQMTGVYLESGFADLTSGAASVAFQMKGTPGTTTVSGANFTVGAADPVNAGDIDWTGTAASAVAPGYGSGLDNAHRAVMTFTYAEGVTWEDVEALIGGYGYRIATLVENFAGVDFASTSGPLSNPDGGGSSAVPTPSAVLGGLGLMGLAGLKRRRDA